MGWRGGGGGARACLFDLTGTEERPGSEDGRGLLSPEEGFSEKKVDMIHNSYCQAHGAN